MRQRRANSVGDRLLMILTGLFLYAPIIILIVFSFNAGNSSSVWKGFSLHWYQQLFQNRLIMHSVYITLLVSLLATVIATIAGTFAAIGFYGMRRKARNSLMAVNNIPMMNADIVTGVSLCLLFVVFFNGWGAFAGWVNSWQSAIVLPERLTMGCWPSSTSGKTTSSTTPSTITGRARRPTRPLPSGVITACGRRSQRACWPVCWWPC